MSNRRHIVFVSSWFPSLANHWNGDFVQRHAQAVSLIHQVTVIHAQGLKNIKKSFIKHNQDGDFYEEYIYYFPKSKIRIVNLLQKTRAYYQIAKSLQPYDIIHANIFNYSIFWAFLQKIFGGRPVVLTEHWTVYSEKFASPSLKWYWKLFSPWVDKFLPVSHDLAINMKKAGLKGGYEVIPNVVDTDIFSVKQKNKNSIVHFLHISSLKFRQKNVQGILNAILKLAKHTNQFHFQIGGNGTDEDLKRIDQFVTDNQLNKNVSTFGAITHKQVAEKMQQADFFVLFSNYETQAVVKFESFSVGTPVISSNLDVLKDNFPENFGLLVEQGNSDALANAMLKVIKGKQFAGPEAMHDYVDENFSMKVIAKKFSTVYESVLSPE